MVRHAAKLAGYWTITKEWSLSPMRSRPRSTGSIPYTKKLFEQLRRLRVTWPDSAASEVQINPGGCMVAGFFPPAMFLVHTAAYKLISGQGAEQQMVDPEALIALPTAAAIVPIGPDLPLRIGHAQSIRPTVMKNAPIGIPAFRLHKRVIFHRLDREYVIIAWDDVIIAGQHGRNFLLPDFRRTIAQTFHPA